MKQPSNNRIVIIGPTASGKSDLAIALAKKYDGEIISADSRQVYRGMDIGTGKVNRDDAQISNIKYPWPCPASAGRQISNKNVYISEGVRHHLLDVASPRREYNISHFFRDAKKAIADIERRGKTVIICGGTHFWIQTLLTGEPLPEVKPNKVLRAQLEKKSAEELFRMLEEKDPERATTIDRKNPYRLIRALEIYKALGKVPILSRPCEESSTRQSRNPWIATPFDKNQKTRDDKTNDTTLIITLNPEKELLRERIQIRLEKRFDGGMIEEVKNLRASGISWKRLEGFGLEYRYIALFLQEKISEEEMKEKLFFESWHYAKRQLSFIRRMEKQGLTIHWITNPTEAFSLVSQKH